MEKNKKNDKELMVATLLFNWMSNMEEIKFQDTVKEIVNIFEEPTKKINKKKVVKKAVKAIKEAEIKEVVEKVADITNVKMLKPNKLFKVEMCGYTDDIYLLAHGYDEAAETGLMLKNKEEAEKGLLDDEGNVRTPKIWKVRKVELLTEKLYNI